MNGDAPPFFNMGGGAGMPQLPPQQAQQNPPNHQQQQGQSAIPPNMHQFMRGAQMPLNNVVLNEKGAPEITQHQQRLLENDPQFLASAALMAAGNTNDMIRQQTSAQQQAAAFAQMAVANPPSIESQLRISIPSKQTKQEQQMLAEKRKPISNPHDHDVMCGRGGLTNFHRGNIWYRRLVKCNRPLYRESAKYTKLLVSKAIVQAVHSQNPPGRFIECEKGTGRYFEIPYKKALDKTSQALREKDKDGEDEEDGVDGLNLTLVRIPLPEEAARNAQQQVLAPSQMQPMNPNMPFSQPFGGDTMTPQQVAQQAKLVNQANAMKAAGMKRLGGGGTMQGVPAGMNPTQQAIMMQAQAAAARANQPNGTFQNGQSPSFVPQGMMPNRRPNTMRKSKLGPTVHPSLPPQYAAMFQNNPMMPMGPQVLDPSGAPRGASGAPRFQPPPPKKPPPSGMPQVLGPSGTPAVQGTGKLPPGMSQSNGPGMSQSNGTMPPLPQNDNGNGDTTNSCPNAQTGPAEGESANPTPAPSPSPAQNSNSIMPNKSATAALEGLAHIAAVQAMEPTATRPLVARAPDSMQTLPSPTAQQMTTMMMMNQQQSHISTGITQQMGIMMNPTMAQQMGLIIQQQPQQTHQLGMMVMPKQKQFQQGGTASFTQQHANIQQQSTMQSQQQQQQQQQQQAVSQDQAGEKRPPYSDPTPTDEQQEYKKQRTENDDMPLPPDGLERRSSSMAEFLRDALMSKGGQGTPGAASKQTILDQMTPQQMQQLALGLLQLAQQQQSEGSSQQQQQQQQQQQVLPLTTPGLQAPPLNRTDHSLGSIGSKSSVETNSSGESGPPTSHLKAQVSDWLEHFFPLQQDEGGSKTSDGGDEKLPPPPTLEKSVSEALLSLSTGPTKLLSDISSILNEKANAARESSTASTAAAPQPSLKPAASTASVETSASAATTSTAGSSIVPLKGELMKKTSTTLPRRGTKTVPPSKMLKLQPRRRGQKPLLPLRPRARSTTTISTTGKRKLLPLKPRPSVIQGVLSSKQQASEPNERPRSIQEEMTDILKRPSASDGSPNERPAVAPGAPPMLQLKRSGSVRPPSSLPLNPLASNEEEQASLDKDTDTET